VTRPPKSNVRYALYAIGCAVVAMMLRYPAFSSGFSADDYAQLQMIDGTYPGKREPWDLYNFANGTREEADALRHRGFFPWFTHPEIRLSMFRPLSSLLLSLDFHLFGEDAFPYHVHSAAWWVAMLLAVAWLYGAFLPRAIAYFALAIFAVDQSHTIPFAWIANRCSLGSTLFGVLGLIAYIRFRQGGSRAAAAACFASYALAVAFGEYGLSIAPYTAAYELWRLQQARRAGELKGRNVLLVLGGHALALWPVVVPCAIYLVIRAAIGRGPLHSGIYIGPDSGIAGFVLLIAQRVPVLLADMLAGLPSESWNLGNLALKPWVARGFLDMRWVWSPDRWRTANSIVGAVVMLFGLFAWRAVVRKLARDSARGVHADSPHVHWLMWGGALAVLPVVGSFPSGRLLVGAEIGISVLFATIVVLCFRDLAERFRAGRVRTAFAVLAGLFVLFLHLGMPAAYDYWDTLAVKYGSNAHRKAVLTMDVDWKRLPSQRVIILAAMGYGTSLYVPIVLARHGRKPPRSVWTTSLAPGRHALLRESAKSFRLAPMDGYAMLANAPEELFADPSQPFERGDVVDLGGLRVTVFEATGRHVHSIRVESDVSFDDPSFVFILPQMSGLRRFPIPPVGQAAIVPEAVVPPL
jgi:hypothetical protein